LFDPIELEKEKNVILEEIAMYEDTPDDHVHDLVAEVAYKEHPLAFPILGTETTLSQMDSQMLKAYMDSHYSLDNTVISIAGNINEGMLDQIEQHFSQFERKGKPNNSIKPPTFHGGEVF